MRKIAASLFFVLLFARAAYCSVAGITEFKAVVVECEDGVETASRIWVTGDRSRRDFKNGKEIVVTRNDLKLTWFIYPQIKSYVEMPAYGTFANFNIPDENADTGDLTRKFLKYDERDSFRMKKYLVTVKYKNYNTEDSYYEWTRNDFPIPVRTESLDGKNWTEYTKISRGPIDYTLFDKPKRYKKISSENAEKLLADYYAKHPETVTQKKKKQKAKVSSDGTKDKVPVVETETTENELWQAIYDMDIKNHVRK